MRYIAAAAAANGCGVRGVNLLEVRIIGMTTFAGLIICHNGLVLVVIIVLTAVKYESEYNQRKDREQSDISTFEHGVLV